MSDESEAREENAGDRELPTKRELQGQIGGQKSDEHTWLSGDDADDPLREEAAERAREAVEETPRE